MARRWRGPLVIENEQTGDGRVIAAGALDWAPLPLPLAWLQQEQHGDLLPGAVQVGTIDAITRDGNLVIGEGVVDDEQPDGAELVRRLEAGTASHGTRQGLSIDPDNWSMELLLRDDSDDGEDEVVIIAGAGDLPAVTAAAGDPDPGEGGGESHSTLFRDEVDELLTRFSRLRIRGVTACAVPAFAGAFMELVGDEPAEVVEDDGEDEADEVVAAGTVPASVPTAPPSSWFSIPEPDVGDEGRTEVYGMPAQELLVEQPDGGLAVPFTIADDGRVFGHAARWGQCHVGYAECVTAPESLAAYAHFHHGEVVCDDGTRVATGTLTMGCDHAAAELRAPDARDHYAHSGLAFADVRATNGALGVWVSGTLRPDVTAEQVRLLRASSLSGDWRRIGSHLEFIGALAVNVPGFPIAREAVTAAGLEQLPQAQLAASAYVADQVQTSLVAAGVVHRCPECQQRALRAATTPDPGDEVRDLLRTLELRTRHLAPAAAEHALRRIRR
jgi:hypothetical protein